MWWDIVVYEQDVNKWEYQRSVNSFEDIKPSIEDLLSMYKGHRIIIYKYEYDQNNRQYRNLMGDFSSCQDAINYINRLEKILVFL